MSNKSPGRTGLKKKFNNELHYRWRNSDLSLGGWVGENTTIDPTVFIGKDAEVSGYAKVFGYAKVSGHARVSGHAWISGDAWISGNAKVSGHAWISGNAKVSGIAKVSGYAKVSGIAKVSGYAKVFGYAKVSGIAKVSGYAKVFGYAEVSGDAKVFGYAKVSGNAKVSGGEWTESPLYIQGSRHSVTHCGPDKIAIGCEVHTFVEWKENYKEIGRKNGYSDEEIEEYHKHILSVCGSAVRV